jgi:hypothetical protein
MPRPSGGRAVFEVLATARQTMRPRRVLTEREARRRTAGAIGSGNKIGCGKCHIFNGVDFVTGEECEI